jgi:hypothetical protein
VQRMGKTVQAERTRGLIFGRRGFDRL